MPLRDNAISLASKLKSPEDQILGEVSIRRFRLTVDTRPASFSLSRHEPSLQSRPRQART